MNKNEDMVKDKKTWINKENTTSSIEYKKTKKNKEELRHLHFESHLEEILGIVGNVFGDIWGAVGADLEESLHLRELGERVCACKHLDDKTAQTPDIGLVGRLDLLDHLGCHPEC